MMTTNVNGLINMTQAILPIFKKRSDGGRGDVINIGSIAGREAYPGGSIYCASKAAVRYFTDALRKELIASRIRIIEIDPGQVETVRNNCLSYCSDCQEADRVHCRSSPLSGSPATSPRRTQSMRTFPILCLRLGLADMS
jgi:3-hydroxy acid dehydrogenase/malonic semialdehyde reductase